MAYDASHGQIATLNLQDVNAPIFNIERVQLQFSIASDFVAAQVANNVLVLALDIGRILRIDLDNPVDIDDVDLPKRTSEVGVIRRMFLDPTASHLIISTARGENYYLHSQSRQPRLLTRLRGISIETIAWNPDLPTTSTREILIGASDGSIYEFYIQSTAENQRKEDKNVKLLQKLPDGAITGLWADVAVEVRGYEVMRILISTEKRLLYLAGRVGSESGTSIFSRIFETQQPTVHEISKGSSGINSQLVISPDSTFAAASSVASPEPDRSFAWLSSQGTLHGRLPTLLTNEGNSIFSEANLFPASQLTSSDLNTGRKKTIQDPTYSIALTKWHIIHLVGGRVICTNQLNDQVVFDQVILDASQKALGLLADRQKNTFWLFTSDEIYEIVALDEDRDIWMLMLKAEDFDSALKYARTTAQKDAVATASGDFLISKSFYIEAASIYGKSSKPFEQVALTFLENEQYDALRKYLLTKITTYKKSSIMQRMMIACWLVEIYMARLNSLDDTIISEAENSENYSTQNKDQLDMIRTEFQGFVNKYKLDLDKKTTYDIITSHGREEELLFFAGAVNDYNYVLSYWMQRERWSEALDVLKKQTNLEIFYQYSSSLITHVGSELVEILMRNPNLEPRNLIPALLNYNRNFEGPLQQNQAVRYLLHCINNLKSSDAAVHNTLMSIYASHSSPDESALLSYLHSQGEEPLFDSDFALRLCIQHSRVQSCVHIYSSMGQYLQAVNLALKHSAIDLASLIADRPISNQALRKKLWLAIAKKVISQSGTIKAAIDYLKRCDLLKIEDLIPFFPDFIVIDDFKDEICTALEEYSRNIDALKKEMDESCQTATNIRIDIAALDRRYAIVEPGEKCYTCGLPLLSRQFYVFPCQHAFHSDCLRKKVIEDAGVGKARKMRELQGLVSKGLVKGVAKEKAISELDMLAAESCILCSDSAIRKIDMPFVQPNEDKKSDWAL
ncbi:Vacuolar protein sorting-associated protein 18 [Podosphaera aphanis]|nr:Vacuolar protein sorting-associated protein 18 [Podosphaera aphanis]